MDKDNLRDALEADLAAAGYTRGDIFTTVGNLLFGDPRLEGHNAGKARVVPREGDLDEIDLSTYAEILDTKIEHIPAVDIEVEEEEEEQEEEGGGEGEEEEEEEEEEEDVGGGGCNTPTPNSLLIKKIGNSLT